jgi:hypothetical protein
MAPCVPLVDAVIYRLGCAGRRAMVPDVRLDRWIGAQWDHRQAAVNHG